MVEIFSFFLGEMKIIIKKEKLIYILGTTIISIKFFIKMIFFFHLFFSS